MTKREIENMCIDYASKAHATADNTKREVRDRIYTAVKEIVALSFLMPSTGKNFRFGNSKKVTYRLIAMRDDITKIIRKRSDYAKSISKKMNSRLGVNPVDWDNQEWIDSIRFEKNFSSRLNTYSVRLKTELEAFISVAQDKGIDAAETTGWFMSNIDSPHTNIEILSAVGFASIMSSGVLKMERGGIKSAMKSIDRLVEDMIVCSYTMSNNKTWSTGVSGKYVITRGDSLVCTSCALNIGVIFKPDIFVTPVHNRCRCIEIPVLIL